MPAIKKWEDLTDEAATIEVIKEVYGDDVEKLDLLVGLLGEKKIPGFAISETAFFIFVLMATRYNLTHQLLPSTTMYIFLHKLIML